jgi:hypothetical protein
MGPQGPGVRAAGGPAEEDPLPLPCARQLTYWLGFHPTQPGAAESMAGLCWHRSWAARGPCAVGAVQGAGKGRSPCRRRSRGFQPKKLGLLGCEAMRLRY